MRTCPGPAAAQPPDVPATKSIAAVGAYSQRERNSQSLEEAGVVTFEYLTNDGSTNSMLR